MQRHVTCRSADKRWKTSLISPIIYNPVIYSTNSYLGPNWKISFSSFSSSFFLFIVDELVYRTWKIHQKLSLAHQYRILVLLILAAFTFQIWFWKMDVLYRIPIERKRSDRWKMMDHRKNLSIEIKSHILIITVYCFGSHFLFYYFFLSER